MTFFKHDTLHVFVKCRPKFRGCLKNAGKIIAMLSIYDGQFPPSVCLLLIPTETKLCACRVRFGLLIKALDHDDIVNKSNNTLNACRILASKSRNSVVIEYGAKHLRLTLCIVFFPNRSYSLLLSMTSPHPTYNMLNARVCTHFRCIRNSLY